MMFPTEIKALTTKRKAVNLLMPMLNEELLKRIDAASCIAIAILTSTAETMWKRLFDILSQNATMRASDASHMGSRVQGSSPYFTRTTVRTSTPMTRYMRETKMAERRSHGPSVKNSLSLICSVNLIAL